MQARSAVPWLTLVVCLAQLQITVWAKQGSHKQYQGYTLLNLEVKHDSDLQYLAELENSMPSLDFWDFPIVQQNATLLVSPKDLEIVIGRLKAGGVAMSVLHTDIDSLISAGSKRTPRHVVEKRMATGRYVIDHGNYHDYDEIKTYTRALRDAYPDHVTITNLPLQTYEGRAIQMVKLRASNIQSTDERHVILMESGIHAREWISPATMLFVMEKLLREYTEGNVFARDLLSTYDLYLIPVMNPDGYAYTHEEERLWRKNRRPINGSDCVGVDLNRNLDVMFGTSSRRAWCSSGSYPGSSAFSERETQAFKSLFEQVRERIKVYVSLHAKGQYLLRPWAYASDSPEPENVNELKRIGKNMLTAVHTTHGTQYTFGSCYELLSYAATGTTLDWALKTKPGIVSLAFELRPRRLDPVGWMLPPEQIIPTGEEIYNGLIEMVHSIAHPLRYRHESNTGSDINGGSGSGRGGNGNESLLSHSGKTFWLSLVVSLFILLRISC